MRRSCIRVSKANEVPLNVNEWWAAPPGAKSEQNRRLKDRRKKELRMGGRAVECDGLENRWRGNSSGGSNPSPSARTTQVVHDQYADEQLAPPQKRICLIEFLHKVDHYLSRTETPIHHKNQMPIWAFFLFFVWGKVKIRFIWYKIGKNRYIIGIYWY